MTSTIDTLVDDITALFDRFDPGVFHYSNRMTREVREITKNHEMLAKRAELRDKIPGPRVGDVVRLQDGTFRRFTHDWDDSIQTTTRSENDGSYYLCCDGLASYSGGLDPALKKENLKLEPDTMPLWFWFFSGGFAMAHNGVYFKLPCRIFTLTEGTKQ